MGNSGETLMEGIISILVLTILLAAITMMIMVSLRITGVSTAASDARQKEANAVLAGVSSGGVTVTTDYGADGKGIPIELAMAGGGAVTMRVVENSTDNFTAFEPMAPAAPESMEGGGG